MAGRPGRSSYPQSRRPMMENTPNSKKSKCPQCGREFSLVAGDGPTWLPFCSERCQWIDLGKWFNGEYRISTDLLSGDEEQGG